MVTALRSGRNISANHPDFACDDMRSSAVTTSSCCHSPGAFVQSSAADTLVLEHHPGHWRHSVAGVSSRPSGQPVAASPTRSTSAQSGANSPTSVSLEQPAEQV